MEFYYTLSLTDVRKSYWSFMPNVPMLLPASSWSQVNMQPPKLPSHISRRAADCGGFVATFKWGDYRYTPDRYVEWLESWQPQWAATMDYCCEPEVAAAGSIVRERQQRTSDMAYKFWKDYRSTAWSWAPTIQGWEVEDYQRHAKELKPLIMEMKHQPDFRVGIGTLCRRASVEMIHRVVRAVADELTGIGLHLWGVKLGALQSLNGLPSQVISVDSGAWNGNIKRDRHKNIAERKAMGMTKAQHAYTVALPRYASKVEAALSTPKQPYLL
jgi:hypothetical protein